MPNCSLIKEIERLFAYFRKWSSTISFEDEDGCLEGYEEADIVTPEIAIHLLALTENAFDDFTDLQETVIEYYEQGIEQWEELENIAEAHASLQQSGDELCNLCDGGCQEFIQNKLEQIADQIEEMRVQPIELDNRTSVLAS
ncbi:hypothetical protein LOD99_9620 [Oopsacas minuta]|uniref:DUF4375 domain-containing protein n=1 Tax=Oopsacas minuta TaxID=111878 RepID=A0AAV7KN79_9METZ|nr:hypothetical protein LOD99_9620 [Oopsacas minuta]